MFGLQIQQIVGIVLIGLAAWFGWETRGAYCDSAKYKAEVAAIQAERDQYKANFDELKRKTDAQIAALQNDVGRREQAEEKASQLEEQIDDLRSKLSSSKSVCFHGPVGDSVRGLWPTNKSRSKTRKPKATAPTG